MKTEDENIIHVCRCCSKKWKNDFQKKFDKYNLSVGDFVKKEFIDKNVLNHEHMWIKIQGITTNGINGILFNEPSSITNIKFGDKIFVKFEDIEAIERGKK
jgi:uncharacterized protein YegJ (DUF2314 family)